MAALFRVKALFEYASVHEDDLSFDAGQIITVTDEEDDDWYGGEYVDGSGSKREGIFPRNFVEKFEPTAPPRPARARPRPSVSEGSAPEEAAAQQPPPPPPIREEETAPAPPETVYPPLKSPPAGLPVSAPAQAPALAVPPPIPTSAAAPPAVTTAPKPPGPATKPKPAPPPPVSEKPSSFKDRIAAFNKPAAPPIAPFKPGSFGGGGGSAAFIKKPFVAPPPSRNAYVPPPREAPTKIYHREEDPEVMEQVAENTGQAERAGLLPQHSAQQEQEEDQPKPTSLKERIALLQKQQLEQAQRHADAAAKKDKPKKPPKKRLEVPAGEEGDESLSSSSQTLDRRDSEDVKPPRTSSDMHRPAPPPPPRKPSDGNEADVSGAGEATESQDNSTERDEIDARVPPAKPALAEDEGQNGDRDDEAEDEEDEEDEEEIDPEVKRREELRARMARMSGGMGFAGMFGAPMNPFGGAAPKKKASKAPPRPSTIDEEANAQLPRAPPVPVMMALPGMGAQQKSEQASRTSGEQAEPALRAPPVPPSAPAPPGAVNNRPSEDASLAAPTQIPPQLPPQVPAHPASEAPLSPGLTEMELPSAPPPPSNPPTSVRRSPPPAPSSPPVPSGSRLPPPPPPALSTITSATEGSESDDELSNAPRENSAQETPANSMRSPLVPLDSFQTPGLISRSPPPPASPRPESFSPTSPTAQGRRYSRPPPPIPAGQPRPPPPPPVVPRRQSTSEVSSPASSRLAQAGERVGELTEYDGDCDTDIASSVHHKDALKARNRAPSVEDSSVLSPLVTEHPAAAAPAPPSVPEHPAPESMLSPSEAPAAAPPLPPSAPAESMSPRTTPQDYDQGYVPAAGVLSSSYSAQPAAEDELQDSMFFPGVPRAKSPPERKFAGPGPASRSANRLSVDAHRSPVARRSTDHHRASMDPGFIASDVDLAVHSGWWKQANQVPPVLQGRKDIYIEYEESTPTGQEANALVTRETFVLYQDYSQTVFTARYNPADPATVELEQRHEPPPIALRQDQMEDAYDRFGRRIAAAALMKKDMIIGDGTPQSFVLELIRPLNQALRPVSTRSYGALVYSNMANASTQQHDVIRPGDILTIRNAKFQGKHGPMHAKYAMEVGKPDHVAVVAEWDGTKKKVRAWEQGRESKKVRQESYKLDDLRSGEVKIWRVVSRSWVGWQRNGPEE